MAKSCQLVAALSLALIALNSCGQAAGPAKVLTPTQVPSERTISTDSQSFVLVIYGDKYCLLSVAGGAIALVPIAQVVNLNGPTPTPPGPTPPPVPPLNARAAKYRDLALGATGDLARGMTAQKLASGYWQVSLGTYSAAQQMAEAARQAGDSAITDANAAAWLPFRSVLTADWNDQLRLSVTPLPALVSLLQDVSAGLNASIISP